jgi:hypothetical protein
MSGDSGWPIGVQVLAPAPPPDERDLPPWPAAQHNPRWLDQSAPLRAHSELCEWCPHADECAGGKPDSRACRERRRGHI